MAFCHEVFSGFEVGNKVVTGGRLTSCTGEDNPCRKAYIDYCGPGVNRPSWDPLTLVSAVRSASGVSCQETGHHGYNEVLEDGNNVWIEEGLSSSNQTYLLLNVRCDQIKPLFELDIRFILYFIVQDGASAGDIIDELLCMPK